MKDGVMVRTIEEMRQNFDAERILSYFMNRKLQEWLSDRHYDDYLEKIEKLDINDENIIERICKVLEIEYSDLEGNINPRQVELKNKKMEQIKQYTDSKEVLDNLHLVAMNQEEFDRLLKAEQKIIYLFGEEFVCPANIENVCLEGINDPILIVDSVSIINFDERNVFLKNIIFDNKYQEIIDKQRYQEEHRNDKKRKSYKPSSLFAFRLSDEDRKLSEKLYVQLQEELINIKYDIDVNTRVYEQLLLDAGLEDCFSVENFGKQQKECLKAADIDDAFYNFYNRI